MEREPKEKRKPTKKRSAAGVRNAGPGAESAAGKRNAGPGAEFAAEGLGGGAAPRGVLKETVARGVAWSLAEKVGSILLQMAVSLTILRLLTRDDLGIMAILTAVSAVALVLADSGFSQTLIRRDSPAPSDFKSVFLFNLGVASLLYVLFVALAPVAARYYDMPQLTQLAPVFFLLLPVNALCTVQTAVVTRQFRFALLSKVTFAAALASGLAAIGLALAGCGVWSVVIQRVLHFVFRALLLWRVSGWRPRGAFDGRALRSMSPYSLSLMTTDLVSTFYNKIPQFFLGRMYPADMLGAFDQAVKLKDQPVTSGMQAVQGVTFPALARIAGDAPRLAESYRQVTMVVAYLFSPVMLGLSAVAHDLFAVLLGAEWMPTVPYFEVVCLAGLCYPVSMVAFTLLKVRSGGGILVRIEFVKKALMTVVFAATIPAGIEAVVWGLVVIAFCEMAVNVGASLRFTTLTLGRLLRTLLPVAAVSAAMYGSVRAVTALLPEVAPLRLAVGIGTGIGCFALLSALFRLEAFGEVRVLVLRQLEQLRSGRE